ncbi:MAG TPA: hypothetical protein VGI89_12080 [Rhizomicrobium sp.]
MRRVLALLVLSTLPALPAFAQLQSPAPADRTVAETVGKALAKAGIDPRTTSVQVVTTADHMVYLKGLISDPGRIKLAGDTAVKAAPGYRLVNNIRSSFFDDPSHVRGDKTK